MIAAFPHMGSMHITLKALLSGLGAQVKVPPSITKRTIELGVQHAPETVCLPFKIMLGTFIEALEQGADTLVTCGGVGPCRLGYYAEIQKGVLENLGYSFDMLVIEPDISNAVGGIRSISKDRSWRDIYGAFRLAGAKMAAVDQVEAKIRYARPRVIQSRCIEPIWQNFLLQIDSSSNLAAVGEVMQETLNRIDGLPVKKDFIPLRMAIAGEIYVMLEPFVNQNLDKHLGEMGVEVHKNISLTEYVRMHLLKNREYRKLYQDIVELAKPFLGHYVGGHGIKTIGCAVQARQQGFDGLIQVFPFTCMPEVIAKNILPSVSETVNLPVLSLVFDEQSGEAGLLTRLEAYIDMLNYRRLKECR